MHGKIRPGRRAFLKASALSVVAFAPSMRAANAAAEASADENEFAFEITRSEAEWKSHLSEEEYRILRQGGTEKFNSSPYRSEMPEGNYACKGCDLKVYDSKWKVVVDRGYVFFKHSRTNSVLSAVDVYFPYGDKNDDEPNDALIEVHCRRCGSHMGHTLVVGKAGLLHCINGASVHFTPKSI